MRILYAEDDLDLKETTASILRDLRFNVEECDNGVALEAYQQTLCIWYRDYGFEYAVYEQSWVAKKYSPSKPWPSGDGRLCTQWKRNIF